MKPSGSEGWDDYAPFYDWENARTLGRADIPFWRKTSKDVVGRVLELGCGTGRLSVPLMKAGSRIVGIDRSAPMLAHALRRRASLSKSDTRTRRGSLDLIQGDVRRLPFRNDSFAAVFAPYGMLQSLLTDRDLKSAIDAVARVLHPEGLFIVDLVPDVPKWNEYQDRVTLRGRASGRRHVTLIESVRQDRRRKTTAFDHTFLVRRGRTVAEHRFTLTFRTLSVQQISRRLKRCGFVVEALFGDYSGGPWHPRADVWIIRARRLPHEGLW